MRINGKMVVQREYCEDCNYFRVRVRDGFDNAGSAEITCEYMNVCERLEKTLRKNKSDE